MVGNVWEWVVDESTQEKIAKSGGWGSGSAEFIELKLSIYLGLEKSDEVGFRIVMID